MAAEGGIQVVGTARQVTEAARLPGVERRNADLALTRSRDWEISPGTRQRSFGRLRDLRFGFGERADSRGVQDTTIGSEMGTVTWAIPARLE